MSGVSGLVSRPWIVRCRHYIADNLELPVSPHRILPMEGLRGFAVFLVFLVHHHAMFGKYLVPGTLLYSVSAFGHGMGNAGVDLFFVLSGYLIYGAVLRKPLPFVPFLRRRAQRIYPAFTAVFLGYLIVCWLLHVKIPSSPLAAGIYIAENYLLLPGISLTIVPLISVAWSLSYEFFFYLLIPILVGLTGMRRWPRAARVVFFSLVSIGHMTLQFLAGAAAERHDTRLRLTMFIAGILLYELLQSGVLKGKLTRAGELPVMLLVCLSFPLIAHIGDNPKQCKWLPGYPASVDVFWTGIVFVSMFALVLYAIAGGGLADRIFTWTPLRWLGNMSYSYYLLHGVVLQGLALLAGVTVGERQSVAISATTFLLGLALTLGAAFVLFTWIERPYSLVPKPGRAGPARKASVCSRGRYS
jgi:exopolysaccharide production protein ExoZ